MLSFTIDVSILPPFVLFSGVLGKLYRELSTNSLGTRIGEGKGWGIEPGTTHEEPNRNGHHGDTSRFPASSTASFSGKDHDHEDQYDGHHNKKSVLTKVKEKAMKFRSSLSNKKQHEQEDSRSPSWAVTLDEEEEEEDPEYLGAPTTTGGSESKRRTAARMVAMEGSESEWSG
ncbi:hypothetical protein U1Q18_020806 [Sarracenia purpurea var. burkii]